MSYKCEHFWEENVAINDEDDDEVMVKSNGSALALSLTSHLRSLDVCPTSSSYTSTKYLENTNTNTNTSSSCTSTKYLENTNTNSRTTHGLWKKHLLLMFPFFTLWSELKNKTCLYRNWFPIWRLVYGNDVASSICRYQLWIMKQNGSMVSSLAFLGLWCEQSKIIEVRSQSTLLAGRLHTISIKAEHNNNFSHSM